MSNFFKASVGKKFIVSLSGLFLITFLIVHLTVNIFLLFGSEAYNNAAHFMATNPIIRIMEPMLAVGFLLHILYAIVLTIANQRTRPENYQMIDQSESSSWPSRNMFILGGLVLAFLALHLSGFWFKMKFGEMDYVDYAGVAMQDAYSLVSAKFAIWWYDIIYIAGAIFLGLHLLHGFQSAFQTVGMNNQVWRKRWIFLGTIYSLVIMIGFSIIPLYFLIKAYLS